MEVVGGLTGRVAVPVLEEVGKAWAQSDPVGGLRFASTLANESRVRLGGQIMRQWAEKNLKAAIAFAEAETDPKFRMTLAQGLVAAWGCTDPAAALAWSEAKLSGPARAVVIGGLVQSAAEKNIAVAGDLVAGMAPGPAQTYACASVFETWFKKGADQREAAFAWLSGFSDPDARREAMSRVQWDWVWKEPDAARDFISGPYGYMAHAELLSQTGSRQAVKNPEAALA